MGKLLYFSKSGAHLRRAARQIRPAQQEWRESIAVARERERFLALEAARRF